MWQTLALAQQAIERLEIVVQLPGVRRAGRCDPASYS
jgi:hypothetical protein